MNADDDRLLAEIDTRTCYGSQARAQDECRARNERRREEMTL